MGYDPSTKDDAPSAKDYWETVEGIAKEAKEAEARGEDPQDYIHESVDGSYYVIYTHANVVVLQESVNDSAAFDEMGEVALSGCNSYGEVMARLAYFAMRQDVAEAFYELPDVEEPEEAEATPPSA